MKYYLPTVWAVVMAWLLLSGVAWMHVGILSEDEAELYALKTQRIKMEDDRLTKEEEVEVARGELLPYREFYAAWEPHLQYLNAGEAIAELDQLAMQYGLGISRKGTSQKQIHGGKIGVNRITVIHMSVVGEYSQMRQFLTSVSLKMPMLRVDSLSIKDAGGDRVELNLQLSSPNI